MTCFDLKRAVAQRVTKLWEVCTSEVLRQERKRGGGHHPQLVKDPRLDLCHRLSSTDISLRKINKIEVSSVKELSTNDHDKQEICRIRTDH